MIRRLLCRLFGHRWGHHDVTSMVDIEPMIRVECSRCGQFGGWL